MDLYARWSGMPEEQLAPWRRIAAGDHLAAHLAEAPAVLVLCADPSQMAISDASYRDELKVVLVPIGYPVGGQLTTMVNVRVKVLR